MYRSLFIHPGSWAADSMPFITVFSYLILTPVELKIFGSYTLVNCQMFRSLVPASRAPRTAPQFTFPCLISRKIALIAALWVPSLYLQHRFQTVGSADHVSLPCLIQGTCTGFFRISWGAFSPPALKDLHWGTSPGQLLVQSVKHSLASVSPAGPSWKGPTWSWSPLFFLKVWALSSLL